MENLDISRTKIHEQAMICIFQYLFYETQKEITNKKVTFVNVALCGHSEIWHSKRAVEYKKQVDDMVFKATKKQKIEYYKSINHALYSEANGELVKKFLSIVDG